jgi:hypothetical protein
MRALNVFAVAGLALLAAAPADAATLRGRTHRGLNVRIKTDPTGRATEAIFNWHVRRCDSGRFQFRDSTAVDSKKKPAKNFFTRNPYTLRSRGGYRSRVTVHTNARRLSIYRWKGTFSAVAIVRRHGRVVDRCHMRRLHWTATTPKARLDLAGDQGDYITSGRTLSYSTPTTHITASDDDNSRQAVVIYAGPWILVFRAPVHHRLRRGHFAHAGTPGSSGKHAGIELSGDGRACSPDSKGSFTIRDVAFDRWGDLTRFSATFVHRCSYASAAARGTVTYRR